MSAFDVSRNVQTHLCIGLDMFSLSPTRNCSVNASFSGLQNALEVGKHTKGELLKVHSKASVYK